MGTIVARKRSDGSTAHMAKIIIKRDGKVVHRESQTFDRKPAAVAWMLRREETLSAPGAIDRANAPRHTLGDAIRKFQNDNMKAIGRNKAQVLAYILKMDIADRECASIETRHLIEFCTELARDRKPATVVTYLSHLSAVFTLAGPAWGMPLNRQAMEEAFIVARRLGLISRSDRRERRPTLGELDRIMTWLSTRAENSMPMPTLVAFAIFSARRAGEITRIRWEDLDEEHSRILVRDMKNPGDTKGNHVWCDLTPEALSIIRKRPRTSPIIFPYNSFSVGWNFHDACRTLAIENLRFHDLRHEGVSRLFELGWTIPHVAAVSGHRSWQNLSRYTHIKTRGDKYAGWKWLETVS